MDLREVRHYLHQHPEVSGEEKKTRGFITEKLIEIGVDKIHDDFFMTSVLAEIRGGRQGKTLLFRCELDALPIHEVNEELPYRSIYDGVGHKCGHDGHMAIMLGLAQKLVANRPEKGRVLLLFQPAEEDGRGARGILNSGKLKEFDIDYIFALHNVPGFPFGHIICKPESFTPSVESLDVELLGKTSHAGMPWAGINPANAIAQLIQYYQSLHQPNPKKEKHFLSSPIQIKMGKLAYGTTAGAGKISYTFRSFDHEFFRESKKAITAKVKRIVSNTEGLQYKLNWTQGFEANVNDKSAYEFIKQAAENITFDYIEKDVGFSWGEDFGRFTQYYRGAMFCIGAGENHPDLHNPDYDFPDELIEKGVAMFYSLTKLIL